MTLYQPPFTITSDTIRRIADISEHIGRLTQKSLENDIRLRRVNRIRTIQGSLAIEGNTLNEEQITALLEGKRVIAPPREIQEARNAITAYDQLEKWQPANETHLLKAHRVLMKGLIDDAGRYRRSGAGVMSGEQVVHMAPAANRINKLMRELLQWLATTDHHPLIASSVFHYEFEFIHPFADGNGRMGRLWQTLILTQWQPLFAHMPVESIVHEHQSDYYQALNQSTQQSDSAPFIDFMLTMILDTITSTTPQVTPHVTPQVMQLLKALKNDMSRDELLNKLQLNDRKSFRERYLLPALTDSLIEMTIPDKPTSRLQKYRLTAYGKSVRLGK